MKTSITLKNSLFKTLFLAMIFVFASCEKESVSEDISSFDASAKASEKANPSVASQQGEATIAEIVEASSMADEPQFTLLLAALEYTGLTSTFAGEDNYTVFAPTDDAFLELLGGDAANLYTLPESAVQNILLYHVTDGRRFTNSVVPRNNQKEIETLQGSSFYVFVDDADPESPTVEIDTNDEDMESNATIIGTDIPATNGVIHVIDAVIIPTE